MAKITKKHVDILCHMLGNRTMFRNHFCADEGHSELPLLRDLEEKKLIYQNTSKKNVMHEGDLLFHVTGKGKKIAAAAFNALD